jgi:hypothetical protein
MDVVRSFFQSVLSMQSMEPIKAGFQGVVDKYKEQGRAEGYHKPESPYQLLTD